MTSADSFHVLAEFRPTTAEGKKEQQTEKDGAAPKDAARLCGDEVPEKPAVDADARKRRFDSQRQFPLGNEAGDCDRPREGRER